MSTPCSQSQIGQDHYLLWQRTAQVEAASALSVVVRWELVRTAVTGTLVARPVRTTWYSLAPLAPTLGVGEGPSSATDRYVGKPRRRRGSSKVTSSLSASFDGSSYLRAARPTSGLAVRQ